MDERRKRAISHGADRPCGGQQTSSEGATLAIDNDERQSRPVRKRNALRNVAQEVSQNLRILSVTVVLFLAATVGVSMWIARQGQAADEAVSHTVENHRLISQVQSLLQDGEIGQRGYLLTGDALYLEPYTAASEGLGKALDAMAENMSDNSRQEANISVLRTLTAQKLSEMRQSVQRRHDGDEKGARTLLESGQGKILMDGVRDVLSRMRQEENRLMTVRAQAARRASLLMEIMIIGLALMMAASGLFALSVTLRRARSAEAARDELLARLDRKLLAILAADIVGYSRLMEGNETQTLARLQAARDTIDAIIERYLGDIVSTAGDSVLVAFSSALSAIDCALEIQSAMAKDNAVLPEAEHLLFRIGLNVGDVIVQNGDVFGDTVNVAARLESLAPPGGICVSRTVRDHIRKQRNLAFEDLGFQTLKNIAQPISAFRVTAGS